MSVRLTLTMILATLVIGTGAGSASLAKMLARADFCGTPRCKSCDDRHVYASVRGGRFA